VAIDGGQGDETVPRKGMGEEATDLWPGGIAALTFNVTIHTVPLWWVTLSPNAAAGFDKALNWHGSADKRRAGAAGGLAARQRSPSRFAESSKAAFAFAAATGESSSGQPTTIWL
jgi:hypothetical protein